MKADDSAVLKIGIRLFGAGHLAVLLGWCAWLLMVAPKDADREWVLSSGPMSMATRYRRVRELEQLREALVAEGYDVDELADPSVRAALQVVAG